MAEWLWYFMATIWSRFNMFYSTYTFQISFCILILFLTATFQTNFDEKKIKNKIHTWDSWWVCFKFLYIKPTARSSEKGKKTIKKPRNSKQSLTKKRKKMYKNSAKETWSRFEFMIIWIIIFDYLCWLNSMCVWS